MLGLQNTTNFFIIRNENVIDVLQGKKDILASQTIIKTAGIKGVQAGDILQEQNTKVKYYVTDIQRTTKLGMGSSGFVCYSIYVKNIEIVEIDKIIQYCQPQDLALVQELIATLKEMQASNKPIQRNIFSKFEDVFVKYAPIATSVGQLLISMLSLK